MNHRIFVVGAGGHSRSTLELIGSIGTYQVVGLLEDFQEVGTRVGDFQVLGKVQDLADVSEKFDCHRVVVAIGDNFQRERVTANIKKLAPSMVFPSLVHQTATISSRVTLADGVAVFAGAVLNVDVAVDEGAVINTGALLEHDCQVGAFASVAPGAILGGGVAIGDGSFVGLGSIVLQDKSVGKDTVIGAGSLVTRDLPSKALAYGSPCRVMRTRKASERYF